MSARRLTYDRLRAALTAQGYPFFDRGDFNLNLVGIRTDDARSGLFNDWICLAFRQNDHEQLLTFAATTDPGHYWLENPMNVKGTAILKPGHYSGMLEIGLHQKRYQALVQRAPVTVYRDNNQDSRLDTGEGVVEDTGIFGINLHRASQRRSDPEVGRWSAGCQVIQDANDFSLLMAVAMRAFATPYGATISYTLLTESELWQ